MLGWLLARAGIECVIVERQQRAHVEARIRAGVLEPGVVDLLRTHELGARLDREGLAHEGVELACGARQLRIDFQALTGKVVTVYGQTEITRDLGQAHDALGTRILYGAEDVRISPGDAGEDAMIQCVLDGEQLAFRCDFVAGCDGFHGPSRQAVPGRREFERVYPRGWLGLLCDAPPVAPELIYASHERGFALASMRSPTRSRYYVEVGADEDLAAWPDARFWEELARRLPAEVAARLVTAPALEKSIAPLRSFVVEPMQHARLFLAGDAAHIVPPTGAKGLNLALRDVETLARAFIARFARDDEQPLREYSSACLTRVWRAERFSWWFTSVTHRLQDDAFGRRLQEAEFAHLAQSRAAQTVLAENYVGVSGES
ncbi:MAG: 4-hydroxybenzoate 3-monooxygenase [Gammaproteobacteria bacterium]|nr:4-hydroxybenzoate 3-monooxygenase [Gammaproteobacteria bacterium]